MTSDQVLDAWYEPIDFNRYLDLVNESVPAKLSTCPSNTFIGDSEVACGPILRLLATHENASQNYRGTILLVVKNSAKDGNQQVEPTAEYYIGPSAENVEGASFDKGSFPSVMFHTEKDHSFYRFEIELTMKPYPQKVKYLINGVYNPDYFFYVPSSEQSMNIMSHSCNGFSFSVDTSTFNSSLWLDVMRKHLDPERQLPYHVMIGGGDQIYCDSIKKTSKPFESWLKHKTLHSTTPLTQEMIDSFEDYYLFHYIKWFGKGFWEGSQGKTLQSMLPIAMSQIPSINIFDDHDIIDGFGSYSDRTMSQDIFKGVGNSAFKYYLLFQQHCSLNEYKQQQQDKFWIFGKPKGGPYINEVSRSMYVRLGKEIGFLGFDCRTERTKKEVLSKESYDVIFKRAQMEIDAAQGSIKHLVVLLGVPICYPRLVWVESIMSSKVLAPIKYLSRKGIILKGLVNEFDGSIELLDDLNDHWCAVHHKKERNWLMGKLMDFASTNGIRITILSGDVHLCCISRFKTRVHRHHITDKSDENRAILADSTRDPRLIFNVISSAIVNAAPPDGMASLLNKRSKIHHFDKNTDEDVVPLFTHDTDDSSRDNKQFLNKRNYADLIPVSNTLGQIVGKKLFPGPTKHIREFSDDIEKIDETGRDVPYDVDEHSLITTLHVEQDMTDAKSKTFDYQVVIPSLSSRVHLSDIGIK